MSFITQMLLIIMIFIFSCFIIRLIFKLYDYIGYYIYDKKNNIKTATIIPLPLAQTTHLSTNSYVSQLSINNADIVTI
jgi:hypothetical protein